MHREPDPGGSFKSKTRLVLGTRNQKKRLELERLLCDPAIELATLAEFPQALDVEETGTTFEQNAALKASQQARQLNHWVLAEDSGLCVEALNGRPGVFSARYAGVQGDDEANNQKLLEELNRIPINKRNAWYACHACLANPLGEIVAQSAGECHGRITESRRGNSGFGYDPYFEIPEYHLTFAELGLAVKSVLSHRAKALRAILPAIRFHLIGNASVVV